MQLVQHDVAEVLEEPHPLRVVGKDAAVQHVRVGDHDVAGGAHRPPRGGRRVAVVAEDARAELHRLDQRVQLRELILRERLRREEVECAALRLAQDRGQHRHRVAKRLPGCRGGHDDLVAPLEGARDRLGLVRVRPLDPPPRERGCDSLVDGGGPLGVARRLCRQVAPRDESRLPQQGGCILEAHVPGPSLAPPA